MGVTTAVLALVVAFVVRGVLADDRHVPIDALPLAPGAEVVATYEDAPVDAAANDTFVRWLVVADRAREIEREFDERERYALTRAGWRSISPPRVPGAYGALSSDGRYRLAVLATAEAAEARPQRLLIPSEVQRDLRSGRVRALATRGRPILVAQLDRYVDSEVGTGVAGSGR